MLFQASIKCDTHEKFIEALDVAVQLSMQTDAELTITGHRRTEILALGKNTERFHPGGIMFSFYDHNETQVIYHVIAEYNTYDIFLISQNIQNNLLMAGKLISDVYGLTGVTHIVTINIRGYDHKYGLHATDQEAIILRLSNPRVSSITKI